MTAISALCDPLPRPAPSQEALARLARRRSAPAQVLGAPGPSPDQLDQLLRLAARTPDHGKLFPWRFVILEPAVRADLAARFEPLAARQPDPHKARAVLAKLVNPPMTVMVVSRPVPGHKVPVWEQELSSGAVCMNLLHAGDAMGFSASWITDWYAYHPETTAMLGLTEGEKVAGFIHLGTAPEAPLERPRPDMAGKVTRLG